MKRSILGHFVCVTCCALVWSQQAFGYAALAMHGDPKYKEGYQKLDYANADAPKGGDLVLGWQSSFDTLNPYTAKGLPPLFISSYVFETLGDGTLDEPFSMYGTLADTVKVADDQLSMAVTLHKDATFSDGKPVTADDLIFSYELWKSDKVATFYQYYWADVKEVKKTGPKAITFVFAKVNPELALITLQMPVLPKHVYGQGDFAKDFPTKAVGTGPYLVDKYEFGKYITYRRNPKFWGAKHPHYIGRYNFDTVTIKYYKDDTALVEGFKRNDFDLFMVYSSKTWALDLTGDKFANNWIRKEEWKHKNNQGSQGFAFNLRNPIFEDIRVRKAIALAFDFDWSNKNLFYGQYLENRSFFENSPLKASGLPSKEELAVLEPLKTHIPEEVFTSTMGYLGAGDDIKKRLRDAKKLLNEAGYAVKDGVATGKAGKLEFPILINGTGFQRILEPYAKNLGRLGVRVNIETKEPSVYVKRLENREYQMIVSRIGQSQSPGNEQREYWGSKAADDPHSRNYSGIKNAGVDTLIDKIIYAKDRAELELFTRCLDRVLYHLHPVVHNWYSDSHRVSYWAKFGKPETPDYYSIDQLMEFMWFDEKQADALAQAQKANRKL